MLSMALQQEIDRRCADLQVAEPHLSEKLRQERLSKADLGFRCFDLKSQASLQKQEYAGRRPGLRGAGDGIKCRAFPRPQREATEELRETVEIDEATGFVKPLQNVEHSGLQTIASETRGDQRVIMRPDRASVIGHRVVPHLRGGQRADAPAREGVFPKENLCHALGTLRAGDAREETMACV